MADPRNKGESVLGINDRFKPKTGNRHRLRDVTSPMSGLLSSLSSTVSSKASISIAATDNLSTTSSMLGYAVVAALVIAGLYAIANA